MESANLFGKRMPNINSTNIYTDDNRSVRMIMFILLLIVEIPSIICICFILIFFFYNWHSMMIKGFRNHAIFFLIIVSFLYAILDLPFIISFYHLGYDRFRTPTFCQWWYWLDYTIVVMSLILTATASIQRHILIFNSHYLRIQRKRWLLHFIPLIFCVTYPFIFYLIVVFFYPCITIIDETSLVCSYPCYTHSFLLYYFDWMFNTIFPVVIIVIANTTLICRVIYSLNKFHGRKSRTWRRQRKLTLQLLGFSSLYVLGWGPSTIISVIKTLFLPNLYEEKPGLYYINNSSYFVCPLQPFICFFALPELMRFIKRKMKKRSATADMLASMLRDTHT